jgi:hypothetical protein
MSYKKFQQVGGGGKLKIAQGRGPIKIAQGRGPIIATVEKCIKTWVTKP